MTSFRSRLCRTIVFLGILGATWAASLLVHELGHGLTAQILGGRVTRLSVWPGIQVWPNPGQPRDGEWGTAIASLAYAYGPTWGEDGGWQDPVVGIMGSGTNLLLAALALGSLWLFHPQGWLRLLLLAESLMFVDLLFYALLPGLFGLPHYLILGGSKPEPIDNAELLGCPRWGSMLLTVGVGRSYATASAITKLTSNSPRYREVRCSRSVTYSLKRATESTATTTVSQTTNAPPWPSTAPPRRERRSGYGLVPCRKGR